MTRILLTGSTGFVGQALLGRFDANMQIVRAVRSGLPEEGICVIGAINGETDWREALKGVSHVVHLAGQTPGKGVVGNYQETNDEGTSNLVDQAIEAGVGTFILMSSIFAVANNASSQLVDDKTLPGASSAYGQSKLAAEHHVARMTERGLTGISLRPPMVYGAKAKGNWSALQRLAASGLPLPIGAVHNRRTMISVDNLASAVLQALKAAEPTKSGAYAVTDRESVSLADMVRYLREGLSKPARLLPVPASLLALPLRLGGKAQMADSLLGNLEIDGSRFRETFHWSPPESAPDAIRRSGREFGATRR